MADGQGAGVVDELGDDEVQLQVGLVFARAALEEGAGLGDGAGKHALAPGQPVPGALDSHRRAAGRNGEGVGALRRIDDVGDADVVVQVFAHAGQVVQHLQTQLPKMRAGADARQHQQLR